MSPLEWGSQDAWLAESLRRVREARGLPGSPEPATALGELEGLLRLHDDEPGWLRVALDSTGAEHRGRALPAMAAVTEDLLPVVSLRCALAAGLATLESAQRLQLSAHTVRHYLERVLDRLGLHSRKALALHLMSGERRD